MSQPANDNFSLHDDEELSLNDDASLVGSEPATNKGDAPAKPPQIITTNTLSNIKLPVLQKDDYDTWAMEMEHYLEYIDNEVWKVIQNGNSKKRVTKGKDGVYRVLPPATQEEQFADEKERKARTLLLMAVPKDHLRRFHGMDDAKEIWAAIKTRFGGNANSKKMQKAVLKQQFEAFTISSKESLEKGYDRFQKLLSQLDALGAGVSDEDANHKFLRSLPPAWDSLAMTMRTKKNIDTLSIDDLYNNLSVFEQDIQKTSSSSLTSDNVAFLSQAKASSSKHKPSHSSGSYSSYTTSSSKATIVLLVLLMKECKFKVQRNGSRQGKQIMRSGFKPVCDCEKLIDCGMSSTVKIGLGYGIQSNAEVLGYEEEMSRGIFVLRETDAGYYDIPLYSRFKQVEYKGVPHPLSGDYTPREQEDIDDSLVGVCQNVELSMTHIPIPSIEQATIVTQKTQPQVPKPTQTVDPSCAQHVKSPRQQIRTPVTSSPIPSIKRQNWNQRMKRDLAHPVKEICSLKGKLGTAVNRHQRSYKDHPLKAYGDQSKPLGFYNLVNQVRVESKLHVNFEEKPNVQGSKEVIDIDEKTDEAAELMVVSSTSLKGATRKAAVSEKIATKKPSSTPISKSADDIMTFRKELDALALKHLGPVHTTTPTSTNPVNTGSGNLNTGFEEVTPGNMEAISPSANHVKEVFSDADDD
ncbi:hypothetical protein Tco_0508601 [Tanacetum coccineum]